MTSLTFRYEQDPTTGLPRLEDPAGLTPPADLDALAGAIGRRFERLASGPDGQLLELNGDAVPGLPACFRVTVTERARRCPTLLLEAFDPPPAAGAPRAEEAPDAGPPLPGRWQAQFLAEAAELIAAGGARSALDFVLADLRALLRKDPRRFAPLLLAGYLHVGDALSRRHGGGADNPYARAAAALQARAADLPDGALDALLPVPAGAPNRPAAPPEEPVGWLRRFFSFS